jgi:hypothetical protein
MNREIKFRAWDIELSIMGVPFDPFDSQFLSTGGTFSEGTIFMQYTGLKDKNGKEIYEGDVIAIETVRGTIPAWVMDWHSGYGAWRLRDIGKSKASCSPVGLNFWKTHEIIGNIHEHPHLLK